MPNSQLLLVFRVAEIRFGIPADSVVEVARAVAQTALPGAPAVVQGVINYRGSVVPVFDVARRFTERAGALRASHSYIVADTPTRRVALHVEHVDGLVEAELDPLAPVTISSELPVAGVGRSPDGLVVLQDLARFLSDAERWSLDRALRRSIARAEAVK